MSLVNNGDGFTPFTTQQYPELQSDFVMELYTDQGLNGTLITSMAEDLEGRLWIALTAPDPAYHSTLS